MPLVLSLSDALSSLTQLETDYSCIPDIGLEYRWGVQLEKRNIYKLSVSSSTFFPGLPGSSKNSKPATENETK